MERIRVLHIGLSHNVGGIETVVHSWLQHKPSELQFDFINNGDLPLAFEKEILHAGGEIFKVVPRKRNPIKSYLQLKKIIEQGEYDYVHHHIMSFSWPEPCLMVNRLKGKTKMIMHSHTVISDHLPVKYKILDKIGRMRLHKKQYCRIACSRMAGESMFPAEMFYTVKNGIDFSRYSFSQENRESIRAQLGLEKRDIVIGHVGRSCYEKNYPFLLQCFKRASDVNERLKLLLIGDILQDNEIQKTIDMLHLRHKIVQTGPVATVTPYYSAMDVFFLPSVVEGISLALLEAQVSGLPCVVSENVSLEAKICNRVEFVPIDDYKVAVEALNKAIEAVCIEDRDVRPDDSYSLKTTSKTMVDIYRKHMS